jgi:tricorn protease-like protein
MWKEAEFFVVECEDGETKSFTVTFAKFAVAIGFEDEGEVREVRGVGFPAEVTVQEEV